MALCHQFVVFKANCSNQKSQTNTRFMVLKGFHHWGGDDRLNHPHRQKVSNQVSAHHQGLFLADEIFTREGHLETTCSASLVVLLNHVLLQSYRHRQRKYRSRLSYLRGWACQTSSYFSVESNCVEVVY